MLCNVTMNYQGMYKKFRRFINTLYDKFLALFWNRRKLRYTVLVTIVLYCVYDLCSEAVLPVTYVYENRQTRKPCLIPKLNPWDPSINKYVDKIGPLQCGVAEPLLLYLDNENTIQLNSTAMDYYNVKSTSEIECRLRPIRLLPNDKDIEYTDNIKFTPPRKVTSDFTRVICKSSKGYTMYDNVMVAVTNSSQGDGDDHVQFDDESKTKFSVIMFGVDSISRSSSIRNLPKMRKVLQQMGSYDFEGFMKVGENTLPNVVPLLMGLMINDEEFHDFRGHFVDKWPFIWKNFSSKGYSTLYAEDDEFLMIFNLYCKGFTKQPTSHYLRPFWRARLEIKEEKKKSWDRYLGGKESKNRYCNQNIPNHVTTLDYLKRFLQRYKHKSKFMYSFFTELIHTVIHNVQWADEDFANFFKWLHSSGHLDNTLLIVFSDHGERSSEIRNTYVGRVESRMPLLSIKLPKNFENMHKRAVESVRINTKRLVTMFDLHQTLVDVLNSDFDNPSVQYAPSVQFAHGAPRGISLFRPIPENRTCADAWISENYCACYQQSVVNVTGNENIHKISTGIVKHINDNILSDPKCKKLSLNRVVSAIITTLGLENNGVDDLGHSWSIYQYFKPESNRERYSVTIETVPGHALFDVTCEYSATSGVRVLGNIDRTNMYGNQSACVDPSLLILKQFCYC